MFGNLSVMILKENNYKSTEYIIDLISYALRGLQVDAFNFKM